MPAQPIVLVIEDHTGLGEVIRDVLSEEGYDVATVRDQYAAMGELKHRAIDLIVADVSKRPGDGDPLGEIARAYPDKPVIVVSDATAGDVPFFGPWRTEGARLTLRRPFRLDDLVSAAKQLVG